MDFTSLLGMLQGMMGQQGGSNANAMAGVTSPPGTGQQPPIFGPTTQYQPFQPPPVFGPQVPPGFTAPSNIAGGAGSPNGMNRQTEPAPTGAQGQPGAQFIGPQIPGFGLASQPTMDNTAVPSIPPSPTMTASDPNPNAIQTPTDPWRQAMKEGDLAQVQQQDRYGVNMKQHPIRSILNIIAAIGQGGGAGLQGKDSSYVQNLQNINSPGYPLAIAKEAMAGQQGGQQSQADLARTKALTAQTTQQTEQAAKEGPLNIQAIKAQIQQSKAQSQRLRALAHQAKSPQERLKYQNLFSLRTEETKLLMSQFDPFTGKGRPLQPNENQRLNEIQAQIKQAESETGMTSQQPPQQPGTDQADPAGILNQ